MSRSARRARADLFAAASREVHDGTKSAGHMALASDAAAAPARSSRFESSPADGSSTVPPGEKEALVPPAKILVDLATASASLSLIGRWLRPLGAATAMAYRDNDIPEKGNSIEYRIAGQTIVLVRLGDGSIKALRSSWLHRAAALIEGSGTAPSCNAPFTAGR